MIEKINSVAIINLERKEKKKIEIFPTFSGPLWVIMNIAAP